MLPFFWAGEAAAAGAAWYRLGLRLLETATASASVVARRTDIIRAAQADPLGADHAELALMVTEKVEAFTRAGLALAEAAARAQAEMAGQLGQAGALMLRGRAPGPAEAEAIARRGARSTARALAGAGRVLDPVHKAATANKRRLSRGPKAKGRR